MHDVGAKPRMVTNNEILTVLRAWSFKRNDRRKNVLPEGVAWVYSDTFGLQRRRDGAVTHTAVTPKFPNISRVLNKWLQDRKPTGIATCFPCTSITVNNGYAARNHRDKNNVGPSLIIALGEFTGGELNYWPLDNYKEDPADQDDNLKTTIDISKGEILFDGTKTHSVEPFTGERYSIVFHTHRAYLNVNQAVRQDLHNLGYYVPTMKETMIAQKMIVAPSSTSLAAP